MEIVCENCGHGSASHLGRPCIDCGCEEWKRKEIPSIGDS